MLKRILSVVGGLFLVVLAVGTLWWQFTDVAQHNRLLERVGLRQSPLAIATTSLEVLEKRRELTVQETRFATKQVSRHNLLSFLPIDLLATTKTLMVSGNVRYVIDLAAIRPQSLSYDSATRTLKVRRPQLKIAEPQVQVLDMATMKDGRMVMWLTGSEQELDRRNFQKAIQSFRAAAQAPALVESANRSADEALADQFLLPLTAAGYGDVRVEITS